MNYYRAFICVDESERVVGLSGCSKVVVYDLDQRKVVDTINLSAKFSVDAVEKYFDEYDPYLLIACGNGELVNAVEEHGVHVFTVKCRAEYSKVLEEL